MRFIRTILMLIVTTLLITSCSSDKEVVGKSRRTVLVYMVATNSLGASKYDQQDLNEMDNAIANGNANNCRLLVFYVSYNSNPYLFEIVKKNGAAAHVTLKEYSEDAKSTTKKRMTEVINDVFTDAPADDYGLVLWSHSDGWARTLSTLKVKGKNNYKICDFGEDRGAKMEIDSLANAIPESMFSFIYADACYLGSVEVAYQLRKCTTYFISSAAELPVDGMPYDKNIPCFFENSPALIQACRNTYDYYNNLKEAKRTLTLSMVNCKKLDAVAEFCSKIQKNGKTLDDISALQHYNTYSPFIYYDFKQYYDGLCSTSAQTTEFASLVNDAVLYKASTPYIFNVLKIDPNHFCGLSTYILGTGSSTNENYYTTLDWYKKVYGGAE